jgi:hypothetical protein
MDQTLGKQIFLGAAAEVVEAGRCFWKPCDEPNVGVLSACFGWMGRARLAGGMTKAANRHGGGRWDF